MTAGVWDSVDVSTWPVWSVEPRGTTETWWLEEPGTGHRWLHKVTVIPQNGVEQGEDWAEVVSTQVGLLLGVPCATTRLCVRSGRRGSLSLNVVPDRYALNEGYVALEDSPAPGYIRHSANRPAVDPSRPHVRRPGHTLANIQLALDGVSPPADFHGAPNMTGFDVFAGYAIFDALVANQDRHEENWAVLTPALTTDSVRLTPSYDHGRSLGSNLTDRERAGWLAAPEGVRNWAERGRARRFEHRRGTTPPSLVEHAADALSRCSATGRAWWRHYLHRLELSSVLEPLRDQSIPGMSPDAATFVSELLTTNTRRLRDAISPP